MVGSSKWQRCSRVSDDLGDRMKMYEGVWGQVLPPRLPILVRVDGRAFHTFTRGCDRPFDYHITAAMDHTMVALAEGMQGCVLAYAQSDEISLLLQQDATFQTQPYFGGKVQKIVSAAVSDATAEFNSVYPGDRAARFDARVWVMPWDEVANYFLWRWKDWRRNSVSMIARAHFSHGELHGKSVKDMIDMLATREVFLNDFDDRDRNGCFYSPLEKAASQRFGMTYCGLPNSGGVSYAGMNTIIDIYRELVSDGSS